MLGLSYLLLHILIHNIYTNIISELMTLRQLSKYPG